MRRVQSLTIYRDVSTAVDEDLAASESVRSAHSHLPLATPLDSWRYRYVKRALDIVGSLLMVVTFLIPGILIALLIRLTSPYPVFYREERIGRYGKPFRIWKFRSMVPHNAIQASGIHADGNVLKWRMQKHENDPRITTLGRFLRRWSLDELPQLFNVLRGEMSLVGPRPIVAAETFAYKHFMEYYLAAIPGLSGLWQVSGRSDLDYARRSMLDAFYVQTWSLKADFIVLFRTIPAVLTRMGAR